MMNITIPRHQLREACHGFSKVINGKTTLPVLSHVRIHADGQGATAQATDLEQVAEYRFGDVQVSGKGDCIVPLTALKALAKGNAKDSVEIETDSPDAVTLVNHVGGHAVRQPLAGMDLDEWPALDAAVNTEPAEGFVQTYRRLLPFASTDETRYVLNGVLIDTAGEGEAPMSMVATDGRRLAAVNHMVLPIAHSAIVPTSKFLAGAKLPDGASIGLRDNSGTVWFGLDSGPWHFAVKTVDGTYPNYRQVIPAAAGDHRFMLNKDDAQVLKSILPAFPGGEHITLVGNDGCVKLFGRNSCDEAWTTLKLDGTGYSGGRSFISVDRHYLLDAINAGFREFSIVDDVSPVLSKDGKGGTHVLMPVRAEDPEPDDGQTVSQAAEPVTPTEDVAVVDVASETTRPPDVGLQKKRRIRMTEETKGEVVALDRVLTACETARKKVRETGQALAELATAIKAAAKDQKVQAKEVESARTALAKLQAISL